VSFGGLLGAGVGEVQEVGPVSAAKVAATSRVTRGANTSPIAKPVATHMSRQNGQVMSSPMA